MLLLLRTLYFFFFFFFFFARRAFRDGHACRHLLERVINIKSRSFEERRASSLHHITSAASVYAFFFFSSSSSFMMRRATCGLLLQVIRDMLQEALQWCGCVSARGSARDAQCAERYSDLYFSFSFFRLDALSSRRLIAFLHAESRADYFMPERQQP